jgi:hypothetical protein
MKVAVAEHVRYMQNKGKKETEGWVLSCVFIFVLSVNTKIENGKKILNVCFLVNQIFGNLGAVTNGLFRSIKRFPSAL